MILSRTPFRISFFGGGTDYPIWYRKHGGSVLGTSINKYCYITCRYLPPFFDYKYRIVYSQTETVFDVENIKHPSVRECLKHLGISQGVEIHHDGDLPARTGIGSSSACTVGLLNALSTLKTGQKLKKKYLYEHAIYVEQDILKEYVGSQDQVLTACGGFNRIDFGQDGSIIITPIIDKPQRLQLLQDHLILVFTGFTRVASDIAKNQIANTPNKGKELTAMSQMVAEAIDIYEKGEMLEFGKLLDRSWTLKRELSKSISTPYVDYLYERALDAGAVGGKLLGAGGGGFLLLFASPEKHDKIKKALGDMLYVPFKFENTGTQIIFNNGGEP